MKYPLDDQALSNLVQEIVLNQRAQVKLIGDMAELLTLAVESVEEYDENPWAIDASTLLATLHDRKMAFENHHFNQNNGHNLGSRSPFAAESHELIGPIDIKKEADLNAHEAQEFGCEMSEAEVASMFRNTPAPPRSIKKKKKGLNLKRATLEEIEDWESKQENSSDIYKVSARIKNAARLAVKANLTPQGDMIANTFTHVVKGIYDLADSVQDKEIRMKLNKFARTQEDAPAGLIAALMAGVRVPQ